MATTASSVTSGCSTASRLRRDRRIDTNPAATIAAQATCSDGIAASWFVAEAVTSSL